MPQRHLFRDSTSTPPPPPVRPVLRWPRCAPPSAAARWAWGPRELSDLPSIRRELRNGLTDVSGGTSEPDEELREELVLLLDELLSNALRHGVRPVGAEVRRTPAAWLLVISDAASRMPPQPTQDRDPAQGGLGLQLVADLAASYGWCGEGGRKQVWALVRTRDPAAPGH